MKDWELTPEEISNVWRVWYKALGKAVGVTLDLKSMVATAAQKKLWRCLNEHCELHWGQENTGRVPRAECGHCTNKLKEWADERTD